MRLDLHVVAIGTNGTARADIDALVAALLSRAAVRANLLAVAEEARLLELPNQAHELARGERLFERIVSRREIALRQLVQPDVRLAREVEPHVRCLAARHIGSREVDCTYRAAGGDALAVRLALVEIDLVVVPDRVFGTGAHAGVAARADLQVDRVFLPPFGLRRTQPALPVGPAPGPNPGSPPPRPPSASPRDQPP